MLIRIQACLGKTCCHGEGSTSAVFCDACPPGKRRFLPILDALVYSISGPPPFKTSCFGAFAFLIMAALHSGAQKGAFFREEKRNPDPSFCSGYLRVGVGGLPCEGVGLKSSVCPSKPGKSNFLAGYPGILLGYPGGARKVWEKTKFVFNFWPLFLRTLFCDSDIRCSKVFRLLCPFFLTLLFTCFYLLWLFWVIFCLFRWGFWVLLSLWKVEGEVGRNSLVVALLSVSVFVLFEGLGWGWWGGLKDHNSPQPLSFFLFLVLV